MNLTSYERSRKRLAMQVMDCDIGFHEWCEPDPCTGRTYCRNCVAYVTGHIDEIPNEIIWFKGVAKVLGWVPEDGS